MYKILSKFREDMQLRGFSRHIIRSYTECVTEYLSLLNETTEYDVWAFQLYLQNVRHLTSVSFNVHKLFGSFNEIFQIKTLRQGY